MSNGRARDLSLHYNRGSSRLESGIGPLLGIRIDIEIRDKSEQMSAVLLSFHGWVSRSNCGNQAAKALERSKHSWETRRTERAAINEGPQARVEVARGMERVTEWGSE